MEPCNIAYDICRCFIADFGSEANLALVSRVDGLHRSRNLAGLASCTCHFDWALHTIDDWRFLRQVEAFFKKNADFSEPEVCRAAAEKSFLDAERQCYDTNLRLRTFIDKPHLMGEEQQLWVRKMRSYVSKVLGDRQKFIEQLPSLVKVTSGASATRPRRDSLPQLKLRLRLYSTSRASKYVKAVATTLGFSNLRTKVTSTNRVELVPKNWKTDRTIACEPEGNLFLQLAFDTYAKRRLRLFGIDLSDQTCNQKLAYEGSVADTLATVDFKAASDTISYNAVSLVFPVDWFEYLDDVRTPAYRGVFGKGFYRKFSSMGNGSTFCIETLLFAAACYAAGAESFSVYGDDVILETKHLEEFTRITQFLGFTINVDKTFSRGPFRESCGKDYFNGVDVTPKFIRSIDKRKASLCHLVNTMATLCFPGSRLEVYLKALIKDRKLPSVPFQESTLSGVWKLPEEAQRQGILVRSRKSARWIDQYRAYVPKMARRYFVDSRGYYLWFLNKRSQALFKGPWVLGNNIRHDETSWAPVFEHSYVRKWVCWHKPTMAIPCHLYWW